MCLTNFGKKKVAQTNIICYKNGKMRIPLFSRFRSLHQEWFTYERFKVQMRVKLKPVIYPSGRGGECTRGYHSYVKFPSFQMFIIPKGTIYVKGQVNDGDPGYTSERIMWVGSVVNPINWIIALLFRVEILKFDIKKDFEEITESMQIEGITTELPNVDNKQVVPSKPKVIKENSDKVTI